MSRIKAIKTEADYHEALELIERLIDLNPEAGSEAGDQLDVLSVLIERYESDRFATSVPDAIEAIKFRMEQKDLKPADLVPYLGSRSRVSEILSGKRTLTIDMVRALEEGLGIPAKVLLKRPQNDSEAIFQNWDNTLYAEMLKREYFGNPTLKDKAEALKSFFAGHNLLGQLPALLRQSTYRTAPTTDRYALAAWSARVLKKAESVKALPYEQKITPEFMEEIAKLSIDSNGPLIAQTALKQRGIILIIEPHLPKTRLDGAAMLNAFSNPVIGMTLRIDRLDNFWFTLMHELAHVVLHLGEDLSLIYDELDEIKGLNISDIENEADTLASEALIPTSKWEVSPARIVPSVMAAMSLAEDVGVHVAVVAGKIRYQNGNWAYLNKVVGDAKVRKYFSDLKWK